MSTTGTQTPVSAVPSTADDTKSPLPSGQYPRTSWDLEFRTTYLYDRSAFAADWHDLRANRWAVFDMWARLVVALSAALSALSLVAGSAIATAILAVTTAIVSALNAALEPSERAASHRTAARDYRHCTRLSSGLAGVVNALTETVYHPHIVADPQTGEPRDLGYYDQHKVSPKDLRRLGGDLLTYEEMLEKVEDASPPISRLLAQSPDGTPRSDHGLRAFERQQKRRVRYHELQRVYADELAKATAPHAPEGMIDPNA